MHINLKHTFHYFYSTDATIYKLNLYIFFLNKIYIKILSSFKSKPPNVCNFSTNTLSSFGPHALLSLVMNALCGCCHYWLCVVVVITGYAIYTRYFTLMRWCCTYLLPC